MVWNRRRRRAEQRKTAVEAVSYRIRHSARARHLQIRVSPWQGVEVVVPPRCSHARVEAFVAANRTWIDNTAARLGMASPTPREALLPEHIGLRAIDLDICVSYAGAGSRRPGVRESAGHLEVLCTDDSFADAGDRLRQWLAVHARAELVPRLEALSAQHDLHYRRVHIRGQRTRWGSCSARGTISLNYKLLFLEAEIVRYLLVHELCHTRHLNHSARYWKLVEHCEPDYRGLDKALSGAWRDVPAWVEFA